MQPAARSAPRNVEQQIGVQRVCIVWGVNPSPPVTNTPERGGDVGRHLDLWLEERPQRQSEAPITDDRDVFYSIISQTCSFVSLILRQT